MKARYHVIASAALSAGVQATLHSWPATLGCFLSGIFIDIDHHLEYYLHRKKFPFRYKDLVDFCDEMPKSKDGKIYLIFHAHEYIFLLWILIYFFHLDKVWIGIALGLTVHLAMDQFANPIKPFFYFITFRIWNKFEKQLLLF